jgi:hypothetical protein
VDCGLLKQLKDNGFRIVNVVPAGPGVPETVIPTLPEMRVAWTAAQQDVMDDSGGAPIWPALDTGVQPQHVALAAPAADAFATNYIVTPAANTGKIASTAPSGGEDMTPLLTTAWPVQHEAALDAANPELPAPSLEDIGWPVQQLGGTDDAKPERRHSLAKTALIAPGRHNFVHQHKHAGAKLAKHDDEPAAKRSDTNVAKPTSAHHHARKPAAAEQHAGLMATLTALLTPSH